MNKTLFINVIFLLCGLAKAGTIDPNIPDHKYIEYGNQHESVVKIEGSDDNNLRFFASAVILEPKICLTAAHVADCAKKANIVYNNKKIDITNFIVPKEYDEKKLGGNGYDISIVILKDNVELDFYPKLYENDDEVNKICSMAGFGMTGNFNTGATFSDGKKRGGSNIINKIEDELLVCSLQDSPKTSLEFLISSGDSGGGLFIDQKLAGIHSSIYTLSGALNSNRKNFSMHTRVSKHIKWIKKIIEDIKNEQSNIGRITGDNGK